MGALAVTMPVPPAVGDTVLAVVTVVPALMAVDPVALAVGVGVLPVRTVVPAATATPPGVTPGVGVVLVVVVVGAFATTDPVPAGDGDGVLVDAVVTLPTEMVAGVETLSVVSPDSPLLLYAVTAYVTVSPSGALVSVYVVTSVPTVSICV